MKWIESETEGLYQQQKVLGGLRTKNELRSFRDPFRISRKNVKNTSVSVQSKRKKRGRKIKDHDFARSIPSSIWVGTNSESLKERATNGKQPKDTNCLSHRGLTAKSLI